VIKPQTSLPAGWTWTCLADLGEWRGGGTPSKSEPKFWQGGTIPWVSPKDMKSPRIRSSGDLITPSAIAGSAAKMIPEGSVLVVTRSGILERTLPVAVAVVPVTVNQDLKALIPANGIDPSYVALALRAFEHEILRFCCKSGTTVASVEFPSLKEFAIPLAPLAQQRRIVAEIEKQLTRLDAGVEALKRIQALLRRFRAAVLKAAWDGNLLASSAEGAQSWPTAELGSIGEIITGTTPPTADSSNYGGSVPFFKPTDLDAGYSVREARQFLTAKGLAQSRELPPKTVLVTCIGATIGKTGVARVGCATNQQINAVIPGPDVMSEWLYWVLVGPQGQRQIIGNASSTTLPILNKSRFKAIRVPVPPLSVQEALVREVESRLSVSDASEAVMATSQLRATRLRASILRRAFDGRLAE